MDPLDPRTIDFRLEEPHRIYGGEYADIEAMVDEEDYLYFTQWLWNPKTCGRNKTYLRRAATVYAAGGVRLHNITIYLHVEVLIRAVGPPPDDRRVIADHLNGDSLDCRRQNLAWVTKRENNQNRFGSRAYAPELPLEAPQRC